MWISSVPVDCVHCCWDMAAIHSFLCVITVRTALLCVYVCRVNIERANLLSLIIHIPLWPSAYQLSVGCPCVERDRGLIRLLVADDLVRSGRLYVYKLNHWPWQIFIVEDVYLAITWKDSTLTPWNTIYHKARVFISACLLSISAMMMSKVISPWLLSMTTITVY